MTELLFQTDSYVKEFDATVRAVLQEERAVILDRTAFYPGGGGQPCDLGSLSFAGAPVPLVKVRKQGEDVVHYLGGEAPLPVPGSASHGTLDWARRYSLMAARAGSWRLRVREGDRIPAVK